MTELFSVQHILFSVFGYEMSYIEFVGTVANLIAVWLAVKNHILNWPIGVIGTLLFSSLFWQVGLYSDLVTQLYFLVTSVWGWWMWSHAAGVEEQLLGGKKISHASLSELLFVVGVTIVGVLILGSVTQRLPLWFPHAFVTPAAYPYLDALIAMMSFAATALMMRREVESWVLWVMLDILSVGVYWWKGIKLVSLLYVVFFALATIGYLNWRRIMKEESARLSAIKSLS